MEYSREFRIYGEFGANECTYNFRQFMLQVEDRINGDFEIIERAKKCNFEFAKSVKKIFEDPQNEMFIGSMITELQQKIRRYSYIKHLEYNGREYEAEIDELERRFYLHEV